MKIIITGGGTGGHINPALAIADRLRRAYPQAEMLYVGSVGGMEEKLVARAGIPFRSVRIMGFDRNLKSIGYNLRALRAFFVSKKQTRKIFDEFPPDLVIGTGGYVSYPVLHLAARRGAYTVLHESNAYPGLVSKLLAPKVDLLLGAVPVIGERLKIKGRFAVTGNPVREAFLCLDRRQARKELHIPDSAFLTVSSGGSLGAAAVNEAVAALFGAETGDPGRYHVHAVGKNRGDFDALLKKSGAVIDGERLQVKDFIHNMPQLFAAADLIISRSGAMSLAEIQCAGRASILIPSPHVTENHQYYNARILSDRGAAYLLEEKDLTGEKLIEVANELASDGERRRSMERKAAEMAVFDAPDRILSEIRRLMKTEKK